LIASLSIAAVLAAALPYTAYAGGQAAPSQATGKTEAAKAKQAVTKGAKAKAPDAKPQAPAQPAPPAAAVPQPAPTDAKPDADKPAETKAPPHFASLRAEKVFLRSGPSSDFPVQWVYERRGLPVEVLASFDIWRKVRDIDGTEGWVHQQMLTGRRSVLVTGAVRDLRRDPDPTSAVVAQLEPGVVAALSHCNPDWCELKAGGYKGWMKRAEVWGLEPDEVIP
jgi:SH3-like domain-containing protein